MRGTGGGSGRWLAGGLACCVTALAGAVGAIGVPAVASAGAGTGTSSSASASLGSAPSLATAEGSSASSSLGSALVIAGSPTQGQQARAAEQARRDSPEARIAREQSRTAFAGLNAGAAAKLAREAFPGVVEQPAGGLPQLPAGQKIVGYPTDNAAQIDLGGGKHGVIESMQPIAVETSRGHREPVDLGLGETGGAFQPVRAADGLRIPKWLGDGVQLIGTGVSLTPADAQGAALGGSEGTVVGTTVFYGGTDTDADTVVKPTSDGFDEDTMLRSVNSPQQLFFKVELPVGASLVQAKDGSGEVRVVEDGTTIAAVLPPSAQDAAGTAVPVSMSISGDTLVLSVNHGSAEYQYPIEVDPEVIDTTLETGEAGGWTSNWEVEASAGMTLYAREGKLLDTSTTAELGWAGLWGYETHGQSHIYEFTSETASHTTGVQLENALAMVRPPGVEERSFSRLSEYNTTLTKLCTTEPSCAPGTVASGPGNFAYFKQVVTKTREGGQSFTTEMSKASVYILQEQGPTGAFATGKETTGGGVNVLYANTWMTATKGAFQFFGSDPGIGLDEYGWSSSGGSGWSELFKCVQCAATSEVVSTLGGWCRPARYECGSYQHPLPNGEDAVKFTLKDAAGLSYTAPATIKVDTAPPGEITLSGLPPNKEVGNGVYHLKASAKDGSGSTPSSGVESLVLKIDGKQFGSAEGSCPAGPCTASGEWAISGSEFAVGQHEVTVTATDKAGNVATETFTMYVARPTTPIAVGPGSVDPQSGELRLTATDVSIAAPGGSLGVSRSYGSLHTKAGLEGPLGPQWSLSIGGSQNLTKLPDGDMLLTDGTGLQGVFASKGGGEFSAPNGDEGLVLTEKTVEGKVEFQLKDKAGSVTTFTPSGTSGGTTWLPTVREQLTGLGTTATTTSYRIVGSITEPTEILAPKPTGVASCSPELVKGCRALGFVYASKTTATGESQSEWGEYEGRLQGVTFTAWEPKEAKMVTKAVAQYQYDKEGKLRAEWNPQISPALKTTYGYNATGQITAVTSPGQQPWLLTYGTIAGDARNGRLIATTRPSASTSFGSGTTPVNSTQPTIPTTPAVGQLVSVTDGTWSNSPLSYTYQWEHCIYEPGETCTPILGATNQSYAPSLADKEGYQLRVKVTATNATGSTTVVTPNSAFVGTPTPTTFERKLEFGKEGTAEGDLKKPAGVAVDSKGNVWVADTGNNRIEEFSGTGTFVKAYGKEGTGNVQFKEPKSIAIDKEGYMFIADAGNNRIEILNSKGEYVTSIKTTTAPGAIALGEGEYGEVKVDAIYVTFPSSNEVMKYVEYREERLEHIKAWKFGKAGSGNGEFNDPTGIVLNESGGTAYVTDSGNHRVQLLSVNTYSEEEQRDEVKYASQFGSSGSGNGQFSAPGGIALEPSNLESLSEHNPYATGVSNDMLVADPGDSRWQQFNSSHAYQQQYSEQEVQAMAINEVAGQSAGNVYAVNSTTSGKNKIVEWAPAPWPISPPELPNPGTSAVSTLEYHVPISGTGAPYGMGASEAEQWGQTDDPVEATAVFPPDEAQSWPAQSYKRASLYYLDAKGRTVNTAGPSGGVSTSEYNATNDVVRSLSPDDRAAALKEGNKSKEFSKLVDTESTYNSEGTELLSTLGPQHTVKLAKGKEKAGEEVLARNFAQYYYNEGAPSEGGPYDLVTKTTDGAQTTSKEEFDKSETVTSYSGQENLGWKLRKPTSVTTNPGGLKLTQVTLYEAGTGNVIETKSPAGAAGGGGSSSWVFSSQLGAGFAYPADAAIDAHGNVWVTSAYGNQIFEYSSSGTHLGTYGKEGAGSGEFKEPGGIAVNQSTGNVYVGDYGNSRVDEWNEKGEFVRAFGWDVNGKEGKEELQVCTATTTCKAGKAGGGTGQFKESGSVALDASGDVWVTDGGNERVQEFNEKGEFVRAFGWDVNGKEGKEELQVCTATTTCKVGSVGSGNGEFFKPTGIGVSSGHVYVVDSGNSRVQELSTEGVYVAKFGTKGSGEVQFSAPGGMAIDSSGNLYVADTGNNRIEELSSSGAYITQFGKAGTGNNEFKEPEGVAVTSAGEAYVADSENDRVQKWVKSAGGGGAHDTQAIYYSAGTEASVVGCQKHPEWANLPCETKPAEQPGTSGLPELPVAVTTYNIWDEPEKTTETVGSSTRTKTATYDVAGRLKTSAISSTVGTALPTVTSEYSSETGALIKQCTNEGKACSEGKPKTITSVYNSLGQLTSYTDADENSATYEYDIDGRVKKGNDGKGTQAYTYNATTGLLEELVDSAAGKFTAEFDVEGNILAQRYPNGMTATYTYNQVGSPVSLIYKKMTDCTEEKEKCIWFKDAVVPSIQGEWLEQTSTLSKQAYTYDAAGRLTQVQNTPTGSKCTTRVYAYDEDTNRTSLKTYEPGAEGKCATEKGTEETHTYDTADRLIDSGVKYSEFGNVTNLPAADAGGSELTSTFYTDNQLTSQTQNGETIGYNLDPAGRTREAVSTGKVSQDIISHYAGESQTPAWTVEPTSGHWTRNIYGIGGSLVAIQNNGEAPVLQLANLHGDIIGTASLSEAETKLLSSTDTSEFGVPTTSSPPKYSWLGADALPTQFPTGIIAMGARSYVPQLGRYLQPDPIPGGSADAYAYVFGNPVNESDPSGEFAAWFKAYNAQNTTEVMEAAAAREKAAEEEAARRAAEAAEAAKKAELAFPTGPPAPLGGYAGWICEDAAETGQEVEGCGGGGGGGGRGGSVNSVLNSVLILGASYAGEVGERILRPPGCYRNPKAGPYPTESSSRNPVAHPLYHEEFNGWVNVHSGVNENFGGGGNRFPEIQDPDG